MRENGLALRYSNGINTVLGRRESGYPVGDLLCRIYQGETLYNISQIVRNCIGACPMRDNELTQDEVEQAEDYIMQTLMYDDFYPAQRLAQGSFIRCMENYRALDSKTAGWLLWQEKQRSAEDDRLFKDIGFGTVGEFLRLCFNNYLIDLIHNPHFVVDADGSGMAGLRDGSINAVFSGSWDYESVKNILGDNLGAAALPEYTLDGTPRQMYAYSGSKAIGVNAHSEYMVPAVELAIYLGSAEAQRLHYELRSVIPCSTELQEDPVITSDPVFLAQNETFDRTSKLQPFVSRMANCWAPIENMGKSIRNGTVTHQNAAEQTKAMNKAMNSSGIQ